MRALILAVVVLVLAVIVLVWPTHHDTEEVHVRSVAPREVIRKLDGPLVNPTSVPPKPTARARTAPIRAASASRPAPAGEVADIIRAGFARFGPVVAEQAVRVAQCESHLNPTATNGQHASLFQISRTYHEARARRLGFEWSRLWEPAVNTAVAADIYASSGWRPWSCRWAA